MFQDNELLENVKEAFKKLKAFGIVASVLMILMGIVMFILPAEAVLVSGIIMAAGLLIVGVSRIVIYAKLPKSARNGADLGIGIVWVVLGFLFISSLIFSDEISRLILWGTFEYVIALMIAFSCIFSAIESFAFCSEARAYGLPVGGHVLSGILGLIAGLIVLTYPIGAVITLTVFYGLFLIIGGAALLCKVLSY